PEPVPRERLLEAIEVARWAPNHRLTEPWHFYLVGEETIRRVIALIVELKTRGRDDVSPEAVSKRLEAIPGWFVLTSRLTPDMPVQEKEDYAACACAVQNLMLYLWQAGIGVKWTTGEVTRDPRLYDILGVDSGRERVVGLFWYGYPADRRSNRKRLEPGEISTELP
ncbi:MAG: nitroreductase, partial [Gammaproteobacteria bacterium]